ncbi:MAG: serine/threonine protein kinase [Labilithrix sp.]|nr:serine/threonine protein kinase [Labilithrix sp.]
MSHRFVRCPHCKIPHEASVRVCPTTGGRIGNEASRSRMSELPPPERKPEPLAFDARNRIAARETGKSGEIVGTLSPTRNLQQDVIGTTVGGRYIVRGILGEGGMGTVYEAEHMGLGRAVAIKVLNPTQAKKRVAVKRFQQEARAAGAIGHPNICEVYDLGLLDDGSPYLVMEKLTGTTLADRIGREGGLPFDELADVMIQVLSGLIAAHDKGIVHRDIKPENIFLARRVGCPPIVKILDFGVSKMMPAFQGGEEQLDLTRTGMVMGTPYYMSPEQARGERNLDGRVDVYACGIMMYEAIAGKRPFLAPNYNALLLAIINTTPTPLREVRPATPPALEAIVARSMAKARADRYPTANHVLRDIQALALAAPARVPAPPTAEERKRAPVLGGTAAPRSLRGEVEAEGAGATLRSRMADAHPPDRRSTRLEVRAKAASRVQAESSGSIEIPIDITGSDLVPLPSSSAPSHEYAEELPTEIFRPGKHPSARSASTAKAAPQPRRDARPGREVGPEGTRVSPVNVANLADEWDGETVVRGPGEVAPAKRREPRDRAFNAEQTVNLKGEIDVDVDFSDETQLHVPPRRR